MIVLLRTGLATLARQLLVELPNFRRDLQFHAVNNNTCTASFARAIIRSMGVTIGTVCPTQSGNVSTEVKTW
jgi:hypothetical protein